MAAEIWLPWIGVGFLASIGISVEALVRNPKPAGPRERSASGSAGSKPG